MGLTRRTFLQGAAASGALLVAGASGAWGGPGARLLGALGSSSAAASRASRLASGLQVVHSDLHNHTLLSDGAGLAEDAFAMMRDAGLDVAALTDHAVMGKTHGELTCNKTVDPRGSDGTGSCSPIVGINEDSWARLAELADAAHVPGEFVAMRGFEWTTGSLGHINVWFSQNWIDALTTGSLTEFRDAGVLLDTIGIPYPAELDAVLEQLPSTVSIDGFYDWMAADPARPLLGGGADALAGFNHPNQYGNFDSFRFFGSVADRFVSCEAHNGPATADAIAYDYWSWGVADGQPWPINALLNAGWHVGLIGVSDNHTDTFGRLDAARGGLWVSDLTRDGVRAALESRRLFSTTRPGMRLDAAANGVPMGSGLRHRQGSIRFDLDLDLGPDWYGETLVVEVARPGSDEPTLLDAHEVRLPTPDEPVITFDADVRLDDGDWIVLRICDPSVPIDPYAVEGNWTRHGGAIAYASPFYLSADGPAGPGSAAAEEQEVGAPLPATGFGVGAGAVGAIATAALLRQVGRSGHEPAEGHAR